MRTLFLLCVAPCIILQVTCYQSRIFGGESAPSGGYPFMAAIYKTTAAGSFFCGGSLINKQWVLTAAQCVVDGTEFRIQMATHVLTQNSTNRVVRTTSTYIAHPEYNPTTLENDIGLLKFDEPITISGYAAPVPLTSNDIADGELVRTIGWGQLGDADTELSEYLKVAVVTTISNQECSIYFGSVIKDTTLCVNGDLNQGFCQGDSGGPLVQSVNNGNVLVGIASFLSGNGCESADPSGYTRLYSYLDWIESAINSL